MSKFDHGKEATTGVSTAPAIEADSPAELLKRGNILHNQRKYEEALDFYHRAVELNPHLAIAHSDLGAAYQELGRFEESITALSTALNLDPNLAGAHLNMGVTLVRQGKLGEAAGWYEKMLQLFPNYALAHHNLGNVYRNLDRLPEALEHYSRAIRLRPSLPLFHVSMAWALVKHGRTDEAIDALRKALEIDPNYANAHRALGFVLNQLGRFAEARLSLERAIQLKPGFIEAYENLAYNFYKLDKFDEAVACCHKMLDLNPECAAAYKTLGLIAARLGDFDAVASYHLQELDLQASKAGVSLFAKELGRLLIELRRVPILYGGVEEIKRYREHHIACLDQALSMVSEASPFSQKERSLLTALLFDTNNFFVAYQQLNDKEIQRAYAEIATAILKDDIDSLNDQQGSLIPRRYCPENDRDSGSKIRLGVASSLLGNHNGSVFAYNLLAKLPGSDYEFFIYSLNGAEDEVTQGFAALGTYRWLPFVASSYLNSCRIIKSDQLDVLLFPDVGITGQSKIVSLMRLALIQCVFRGHPITTGSPQIDYFLSSDLMESEDADDHYIERLVRVPNVGWYLEEPKLPATAAASFQDFGIPDNKVVFGSVQSLFKYLPQYDYVFPAIVKAVPNSFLVFAGHRSKRITDTFQARLRKAFSEAGVNFEDHARVLPRLDFKRFVQLLKLLDVNLDSIGWSGGATTRLALAVNLPTLTFSAEFMRGRHSHGMLKMIGLDQLIASSLDEYIALAIKLGRDAALRLALGQKVKENKHKLFHDMECIEYLDRFFKSEVSKIRHGPTEVFPKENTSP